MKNAFPTWIPRQCWVHYPEVVVRRCFVKKVFLKISQNSQENTCARAPFLIKLQPCRRNDVAKTSWGRLNFGFIDVLDWSEMVVATTFF